MEELAATMDARSSVAALGLSRATYYRRRKGALHFCGAEM